MSRLSVQRKILLAFAAAMLLLTAIATISYGALRDALASTVAVRHSHEVLETLNRIELDVTEAESAARGFLLTGEAYFLDPYGRSVERARRDLAHLRTLVDEDPAQRSRAVALAALVEQRLAIAGGNVATFQRGDWPAAIAAVRAGGGREAMARVRRQADRMIVAERGLLETRRERESSAVTLAFAVILSGFGLALLVSVGATLTIGRDVRARERINSELEDALAKARSANRAKSDFMARMSHELRTPLNSVIGFANVLLKNKRATLDEQDISFVDRIQANGRHLLGIINDILDLAKVEAGRMDVALTSVDVGNLVVETMREFDWRDGVRAEMLVPERLASIQTDRDKLRQVLLNLVSNAAKFTERGRVLVRVAADPETHRPVRIDVIDSGIGIAPGRTTAIFQAFEQAEVTTARRFGGTGLGLAIARSICERLGFRLGVVSTLGGGSTFSVALQPDIAMPLRHETPPAGTVILSSEAQTRRLVAARGGAPRPTVLVIDDSSDARLLISQFVEDAGYQAISAVTGEQGLQMALEFRPELITVDLMMPGMDGIDFVRRLKMHPSTSEIPVVVVSIVASEQRGGVAGAAELVDKPIVREELVGAIRRNLGKSLARVLVVEDDPDARALVEAHLTELPGFEARFAFDGESAIDALDHFAPDLVLLDLTMPGVDGLELLSRLREDARWADVPVVVTTSRALGRDEAEQLERQALAVVPKGLEFGERLRRVLRGVLREVRAREVA